MELNPNFRLWVYSNSGLGVFGDGKVRLLKAIEEQGSLREAARHLDISYRKAWEDLKRGEACLGVPLVHRLRGGKAGGMMQLTDVGKRAIAGYDAFRQRVEQTVEQQFELFRQEIEQ